MIVLKPSYLKLARPLVRYINGKGRECTPNEVSANTKLTILPNGIRIASEESRSAMTCISLFCEAGSRYEKACNNGIFHFIEHLIYKGFKCMNKCQLQDLLFLNGIKFSAKTGREIQVFSAQCLPECGPTVVDIFSRIVCEPAFNECEIEMERYNLALELSDTDSDPRQTVFDYLHRTAFQGTPLAQPVIGPTSNLEKFDSYYCNTIMRTHYQPYKLAFASSGCINHDDMVQRVNCYFGCLSSDPAYQSDEGPSRFTGSEVRYRNDDLPFAHVAIAFEAPGFTSVHYWTMLVAACMVGSWDRSQGRGEASPFLLAQAGDTGICEKYEAFYLPYRDVGLWGIYFVGDKMRTEDMLYNIANVLMSLCVTVQETEVERGINRAKLMMARSVNGAINSCHDIGMQLMYRCGRQSLEQSYSCLESVNTFVLREICDNHIYDRDPVLVSVGPVEAVPEYNRVKSSLYWLRR